MTLLQYLSAPSNRLVKDKKYGGVDKKSEAGWNGMVGELIKMVNSQQADRSPMPVNQAN
jgi:hypothetical protein